MVRTMALDHLALLTADLAAFSSAIEHGSADAPIAGCPGWTLAELGEHLGEVHRWVIHALVSGAAPDGSTPHRPAPITDMPALAEWVREGAARMLVLLEAKDPTEPTWHPFPVEPKVAGLWRRRQAQEASVHRWDAETAIGCTAIIEPEFAADGIDEYFGVMLPRMLLREGRSTPPTSIEVTLNDRPERWVVSGAPGLPVVDEAAVAHATVHGDAASVLLALWGRPPARPIQIGGDESAMQAWLALGGA
jgi:uncharacterized protein (TIGR03083 family)